MSDVLTKICTDKRDHVDAKMRQRSLGDLKALLEEQDQLRGFIKALNQKSPALVTEVKKASPSKGIIRADFDPVKIAQIYKDNGAACLSVLTDEPYFQGHDDYFTAIRSVVDLPMLRKDFMIDEYQIYESRLLGADCILLIMACLTDAQASAFYDIATQLGMDSLFEVHDAHELERALALKPKMLGVNNRNLKTLDVSLQTGLDLAVKIPDGIMKVAESGIYKPSQIIEFKKAGYGAFLIGESLMREHDIGQALSTLLTQSKN